VSASVVDGLASHLREAILDGELEPGRRLREVELAGAHGAARHSVRAALRALAAERLVTIERHVGARVAVLDGPAGRALYELRTALEVEAAHLALRRHDGRLPEAVHLAAAELAAVCRRPDARWSLVSRAHDALHATSSPRQPARASPRRTPPSAPRRACSSCRCPATGRSRSWRTTTCGW
jgi:DNA-binding GntR family transcriptional regulator